MGATVLVFGDSGDPHIEAVSGELGGLGATTVVIDPSAWHRDLRLSYQFSPEPDIVLEGDGWALRPEQVDAVWWRVKPYEFAQLEMSGDAAEFADREWRRAIEALPGLLPRARWMNPREAARRARSKPFQLFLASECGLTIPSTLISNEPARVRQFVAAAEGDAIYKTLSWFFVPPNETIYTTAIGPADVTDDAALVLAPGIFQERLRKDYEVRATVVGESIHAVAIDSQAHPEARLDWRRVQQDLSYERIALPASVAAALLALTERLGLAFAAHDLVVTPDGEHVFLEVNAMGQWLWLEDHAGAPIAATVAAWLASAA